jgi:hypothetical protein
MYRNHVFSALVVYLALAISALLVWPAAAQDKSRSESMIECFKQGMDRDRQEKRAVQQ